MHRAYFISYLILVGAICMNCKYDIAISYKSEIEGKASKLADYLKADGWKVFYAPLEQEELLSEKLHQKLYEIYKNESLMKILLISDTYLASEWTALEKRVSLQETREQRKRLLIVNYTDNDIGEELKELVYLDGRKMYEDEIAAIATKRLRKFLEENFSEAAAPEKGKSSVTINNNHGIIAGNNAHFGDIHF